MLTLEELKTPGTELPYVDWDVKYSVINSEYFPVDDFTCTYPSLKRCITYGVSNRHSEKCILIENIDFVGDQYYEIPISELKRIGVLKKDKIMTLTIEELRTPGTVLPDVDWIGCKFSLTVSDSNNFHIKEEKLDYPVQSFGTSNRHSEECILIENQKYQGDIFYEIPISELKRLGILKETKTMLTLEQLRILGTKLPIFKKDNNTRYSVSDDDESWKKDKFDTTDFSHIDNYISYGTTNRHTEECILMENIGYYGKGYFEIPISEFTKYSNFEQVIKLPFDVNTLKIPGTKIPKFNPYFSIKYSVANSASWEDKYFNHQYFLFDYVSYGTTNRHDEECILIEKLEFEGKTHYEVPISEFLKPGIFEGYENKSVYKKYTEEYCDNIVIAVSCGEEIQECDRLAGHRLHEQLYSGVKHADHICIVPYTKGYATKEFYESDGFEIINYMEFIKSFE